jgi:hypothetical protein
MRFDLDNLRRLSHDGRTQAAEQERQSEERQRRETEQERRLQIQRDEERFQRIIGELHKEVQQRAKFGHNTADVPEMHFSGPQLKVTGGFIEWPPRTLSPAKLPSNVDRRVYDYCRAQAFNTRIEGDNLIGHSGMWTYKMTVRW